MSDPYTFDAYRWYDPALARCNTPETLGEYAVKREDDILTMPDAAGEQPVKFRCRVLTRSQRRKVRDLPSDSAKHEAAFRLGLLSIENLPGGKSFAANRASEYDPLNDHQLDSTGLGDIDIEEIGSVILGRSFLAQGAPPSYPLLDSSLRAFGAITSHAAEPKRANQG